MAIEAIFKKGYQKVICIGNDCPALNSIDLLNAARELDDYQMVLGPDLRGGAYLIGITKDTFDSDKILSLPWQTQKLFGAFIRQFPQIKISILDILQDINSQDDLLKYTENKSFIQYLIHFFVNTPTLIYCNLKKEIIQNYGQVRKLRGPPQLHI